MRHAYADIFLFINARDDDIEARHFIFSRWGACYGDDSRRCIEGVDTTLDYRHRRRNSFSFRRMAIDGKMMSAGARA